MDQCSACGTRLAPGASQCMKCGRPRAGDGVVCGTCLSVGLPKRTKARPGSGPAIAFVVCLILGFIFWPLLLLAGLFFLAAVARAIAHAAGGQISLSCGRCGAANVMPIDTPMGQHLLAQARGGHPPVSHVG